ncbi:hypothetical protein [Hydrogenophaga sp.]|uniref:hypothetical protein n=1 Tax=Hydrogenophaga sp. TaxID=1904254 RepID=UPI00271B7BDB|nr:hypothetical protein [Hydrogenophaga sp.]MDO9438820.1 hypothetical protein [Hydrogenophaga sp.]
MARISATRGDQPTPSSTTEVKKETPPRLDVNNPAKLAELLQENAWEHNAAFTCAPEKGCGMLRAVDEKRIIILPNVSLCIGIAFRSNDTGNWYALHSRLDDKTDVVEAFKAMASESNSFECDNLVLMNAPRTIGDVTASEDELAIAAKEKLRQAGGFFDGDVLHIDCSFNKPFDERRIGLVEDLERRHIMIIPKSHSVYVFDESHSHVSTHLL